MSTPSKRRVGRPKGSKTRRPQGKVVEVTRPLTCPACGSQRMERLASPIVTKHAYTHHEHGEVEQTERRRMKCQECTNVFWKVTYVLKPSDNANENDGA
jgi:ribosomal protein L37AE/L43A